MLNWSILSSDNVVCHRGPPSQCPVIIWEMLRYDGINMGDDEVLTVRFHFNGEFVLDG